MKASELQLVRRKLLKTQKQMSQLLGLSIKTIQSFEQGWRKIPGLVERQALFSLALKAETRGRFLPCWKIRHCSLEMREMCPAWEFKSGHLCWFINGTICQGKAMRSWSQKMVICKKCKVFGSFMKHWDLR